MVFLQLLTCAVLAHMPIVGHRVGTVEPVALVRRSDSALYMSSYRGELFVVHPETYSANVVIPARSRLLGYLGCTGNSAIVASGQRLELFENGAWSSLKLQPQEAIRVQEISADGRWMTCGSNDRMDIWRFKNQRCEKIVRGISALRSSGSTEGDALVVMSIGGGPNGLNLNLITAQVVSKRLALPPAVTLRSFRQLYLCDRHVVLLAIDKASSLAKLHIASLDSNVSAHSIPTRVRNARNLVGLSLAGKCSLAVIGENGVQFFTMIGRSIKSGRFVPATSLELAYGAIGCWRNSTDFVLMRPELICRVFPQTSSALQWRALSVN